MPAIIFHLFFDHGKIIEQFFLDHNRPEGFLCVPILNLLVYLVNHVDMFEHLMVLILSSTESFLKAPKLSWCPG